MTTSDQPARGKRSNNEGTAPKLRKDCTYQANYVAGYLPSGKPFRKSVYGNTGAACVTKLKTALQQVSGGTASLSKSPRPIEWLDRYLDVVAPNSDVQPRTINAYRSKIDNYVRAHRIFGKRLDKLTPTDMTPSIPMRGTAGSATAPASPRPSPWHQVPAKGCIESSGESSMSRSTGEYWPATLFYVSRCRPRRNLSRRSTPRRKCGPCWPWRWTWMTARAGC